MAGYKLEVVHRSGGNWVVDADIDAIASNGRPVVTAPFTRVLNGIGSGSIALATDDADHDTFLSELAVDWPAREVRLWREGSAAPWWWGVPVRPTKQLGQRGVRQIQLAEIPWLFTRLHFGKANRTNYLGSNAGAELGTTSGWTSVGVDSATASGGWKAKGDYSFKLVNSGSEDASLQRSIVFTSGPIGNTISVAAHFYIDTWNGPPFANRGLYAEMRQGGTLLDHKFTRIDDRTPRGSPERAEIPLSDSLWVPPNTTVTLNVRGYSIDGAIYWDEFFLGVMESIGSGSFTGTDLTTFAVAMVNHAQDPTYDKDDLHIGLDGSATGRKIFRGWQFADHGNIWNNGILDLCRMEDGIDFSMVYGANGRVARIHNRVAPALGKGQDRTALDMSLTGANVLDWGHTRDADQAVNSVVVLGDGDGPDREEAAYVDLTRFGGRALELIEAAPPKTPIDLLDEYARQVGRVHGNPSVLTLAFRPGRLVETVEVGDRLSIPAYDPFVDAGTYRVMDVALNCRDDMITVGVNPA